MANEIVVAGDSGTLDKRDELFCQLLINGGEAYGGDLMRCYKYVYKEEEEVKARQLIQRHDIRDRLKQLEEDSAVENALVKRYATTTLKKIIEETSTSTYFDRFGTELSPAPLRAVAVNATRLLMDIHSKKEKPVAGSVNISNNEGGGITFNVLVPEGRPKEFE